MAWQRRRNRGRPPGQSNQGGGGGTPKLAVQTHIWSVWSQGGLWYVRYSIKVTRGIQLISNCRVQFLVSGTDEGQPETTDAAGTATHIYEDVDSATKALVVGARIFDPVSGQPIDVRCTETIPLGQQESMPAVVANFLRLGHDTEYVGQHHDVPGFALKRKESEVTPATERRVMLECQNEHLEATTDGQGRFVFTVEVHGKGARATITCDDAKETIYLRGPAFRGVKHLPPQGRRPDRNAPWPVRALDALREGANSGRREGDMADPSNAYADVGVFADHLPFFLPSLFSMTGHWMDLIWSTLVVLPLVFSLTFVLATGWTVFGIAATILTATFAFATHSWFGVRGLGWLLRGTDNRRWCLCILMVIALTVQLYRAPWQLQPSNFSVQTSQSEQYWNEFSDWVEGVEKPSIWQQAKEWLHTKQPATSSGPILYGPVRTKGFIAFWLIIWLLITVLYFPVAFEDEVMTLLQRRAEGKAEAEYHKAVLESLRGGKSPPQKPQPHEGRYDSHFEGLSRIALLGVVLEEVRETLSGIRGWRRKKTEERSEK